MAARAPAARAALSVPPSSGRRDSAASVRSLTRRGPASRAGPVRSASSSSVGTAGAGAPCAAGAVAPRAARSNSANTSAVESPSCARAITQWWRVSGHSSGAMWSPRPVPRAMPPVRQAGTSAPRARPIRSSWSGPRPSPHSALQATRVAAASADPPAIPPATGTLLSTRMARPAEVDAHGPAAARRCMARAARTARWDRAGTARMSSVVARSMPPPGRWATVSTVVPGVLVVRTVTVSRRSRASKTVARGW